jgi:nitrogen fixation-related uncharacterized protein
MKGGQYEGKINEEGKERILRDEEDQSKLHAA